MVVWWSGSLPMTQTRFPWTCPSCGATTVTRLEKDTDVDLVCETCRRTFGEKRETEPAPPAARGTPRRRSRPVEPRR